MKKLLPIFIAWSILMAGLPLAAQTNLFVTNPDALSIMTGDYNPVQYRPSVMTAHPDSIRMGIIRGVDPGRMIENLSRMELFYNRNSGSDTLSLTTGIGAARSWILAHFEQVSKENEGRLVTGYLEFDLDICGSGHHKNPFALLPGLDTSNSEIIVIEGHFDTRNEDRCDTEGFTPGIDDNGSGTVLVMELARVMSRYAFDHTILFTTPTGEDQGLHGAKAWAEYLSANKIKIRAVLNNDIVGGIYCGRSSPQPSCPYWGHVDSTHVRIFSFRPIPVHLPIPPTSNWPGTSSMSRMN
ncbi:MAG: M28 family peptidase [Bacteroidales bacterium]